MLRVVVREVASHQDWKTRRDVRTGGDEVSPVTAWRVITRCFSSFPCHNKTGCLISCLVLTRKYDMTSGRAPYGLLRGAVSHQVFLVKGEKKKMHPTTPRVLHFSISFLSGNLWLFTDSNAKPVWSPLLRAVYKIGIQDAIVLSYNGYRRSTQAQRCQRNGEIGTLCPPSLLVIIAVCR